MFDSVEPRRAGQLPDRNHARHLQRPGSRSGELPGRYDARHGRGKGNRQVDEPAGPRPGRAQHAGDRGGLRPLLSALKDARVRASQAAQGAQPAKYQGDRKEFIEPCGRRSTPRRFAATPRASCRWPRPRRSTTGRWTTATSPCCGAAAASSAPASWSGSRRPSTPTASWKTCCWPLTSPRRSEEAQDAWRHAIVTAVELGIPVPAFTTALAYYDGYPQRPPAGQPAASPARLFRRPHLRAHRQARHVPQRLASAAANAGHTEMSEMEAVFICEG